VTLSLSQSEWDAIQAAGDVSIQPNPSLSTEH
jgi:hypothetical protein